MAQRAITDILDDIEELIPEIEFEALRNEMQEFCNELREKARDIAVDIYNR